LYRYINENIIDKEGERKHKIMRETSSIL